MARLSAALAGLVLLAGAASAQEPLRIARQGSFAAGGMVLAYFEWVQDVQSFFWTEQEITADLERIMDGAFGDVLAMSEAKSVDLRGAAMMVAVERVAGATSLRGLYP